MKKVFLLFTITLPFFSFSQNEKIKVTYGAEHEYIPAIVDTIISNEPKSRK